MLFYQANLGIVPHDVLAITVQRLRATKRYRAGADLTAVQVKVWFVDRFGAVRRHRGECYVQCGQRLDVAGYQVTGTRLLITLRSRRGHLPGTGLPTVADQFVIPFRLDSCGSTHLVRAECSVHALCRPEAEGLTLSGSIQLLFELSRGTVACRIPFLRWIRAAVDASAVWHALTAVSRFELQVSPAGNIAGAVQITALCGQGKLVQHGGLKPPMLRDVSASVSEVRMVPIADGEATVSARIDVDLYLADGEGMSRWAGRSLSRSQIVTIPGALTTDRLEAQVLLDTPHCNISGSDAALRVTGNIHAAAYRSVLVPFGTAHLRVEQLVGTGVATIELAERIPLCSGTAQFVDVGIHRVNFAEPSGGTAEPTEWIAALATVKPSSPRHILGSLQIQPSQDGQPRTVDYPIVVKRQLRQPTIIPSIREVDGNGMRVTVNTLLVDAPASAGAARTVVPLCASETFAEPIRTIWGAAIDEHATLPLTLLIQGRNTGLRMVDVALSDASVYAANGPCTAITAYAEPAQAGSRLSATVMFDRKAT